MSDSEDTPDDIEPGLTPVDSTNVAAVGWTFRLRTFTRTLIVQFHNGSVYEYFGVPRSVYKDFLLTPTPGKYLYSNVKGRYDFERVQ